MQLLSIADHLLWASYWQASRGITTAGDHGRLAWLVTTAAVVGYSLAVCVAVPFFFELVSGCILLCSGALSRSARD